MLAFILNNLKFYIKKMKCWHKHFKSKMIYIIFTLFLIIGNKNI